MKKEPWLAFFLSFLIPGAGLIYLGKYGYGVFNFVIVLVIGFLLALLLPEEWFDKYIQVVAIGCSAGSGSLARAIAIQMNRQRQ